MTPPLTEEQLAEMDLLATGLDYEYGWRGKGDLVRAAVAELRHHRSRLSALRAALAANRGAK